MKSEIFNEVRYKLRNGQAKTTTCLTDVGCNSMKQRNRYEPHTCNKRLKKLFRDIIFLIGILKSQAELVALQSFHFINCKYELNNSSVIKSANKDQQKSVNSKQSTQRFT